MIIQKNISMCLERISKEEYILQKNKGKMKIVTALTSILPFLAKDYKSTNQLLLDFFKPFLVFSVVPVKGQHRLVYFKKRFIEIAELIPQYYTTL